jgi:hypothetical protein
MKTYKNTIQTHLVHTYILTYLLTCVIESGGLRVCNREVAVDSSLGKTVYLKVQDEKEALKRDMGVAHTDVDIEVGEEDVGEDEDDDEEEGEDGEEGEGEEEEGEEGEGEGDEEEENEVGMTGEGEDDYDETEGMEDEEDKEEEEDRTDDVEKGCTVFVRYVTFAA